MKVKTVILAAIPIIILSLHTCTKDENGNGNGNGKLPTLSWDTLLPASAFDNGRAFIYLSGNEIT